MSSNFIRAVVDVVPPSLSCDERHRGALCSGQTPRRVQGRVALAGIKAPSKIAAHFYFEVM